MISKLALRRTVRERMSVDVPGTIEAGDVARADDLLFMSLDLPEAVRVDPSVRIDITVYASRDEGKTWQSLCGGTFRGDPELPATQPIGMGLAARALIGAVLRVEVESDTARLVGCDVRIGTRQELELADGAA